MMPKSFPFNGFVTALTLMTVTSLLGLRLTRESNADIPQLGNKTDCTAYRGLPKGWRTDPYSGMRKIEGGYFFLGSTRGYAEERPVVRTKVESFWIDRTEVTNAQFATFVAATGYKTTAEQSRSDGNGSVVFRVEPKQSSNSPIEPGSWWHLTTGADWRHPNGPNSSIDGHEHEPVINVSIADALAYSHWLGRTLPTEAQWEYAAKAERTNTEADQSLYDAKGKPQANFWQGFFPLMNTVQDGYAGRAPVGCFKSNPNGLYDMVGNVWEWTIDAWHDRHNVPPLPEQTVELLNSDYTAKRYVIKGGSYLCAMDYCARARTSSRQPAPGDLPSEHIGFRTVIDQN